MGELFDKIVAAVEREAYLVSEHASERLEERNMMEWQAVDGLSDGRLLREDGAAQPNPTVEVEQFLPDGTAIKAVWAWISSLQIAKLVTVHYYDQ